MNITAMREQAFKLTYSLVVQEQENINAGLSIQVDELDSLSNIQDIEESYGLRYNNDNIVVVK